MFPSRVTVVVSSSTVCFEVAVTGERKAEGAHAFPLMFCFLMFPSRATDNFLILTFLKNYFYK
jgi:hypothetical protein